ncbi:hypothetical protein VKT23_002995 [Stygiomarasmius scandens]|uniref:Uncharacterized protein n=1 Tax=Marasmiellus scandens TaxID=2682957 RepID=A0ABR1JWN6_9AGAR
MQKAHELDSERAVHERTSGNAGPRDTESAARDECVDTKLVSREALNRELRANTLSKQRFPIFIASRGSKIVLYLRFGNGWTRRVLERLFSPAWWYFVQELTDWCHIL